MKFISVAVLDSGDQERELNRFLAAHRILDVERRFIEDGGNSRWCFCINYRTAGEPSPGSKPRDRIDYKEQLNEADFAVYSRIRELRKQLAEKEGVPIYSVFKNAQLAAMVEQRVSNLAQLQGIDGVGEGRARKYGEAFLAELKQARAGHEA